MSYDKGLSDSLSNLTISPSATPKALKPSFPRKSKKSDSAPDSWDDALSSSEDENEVHGDDEPSSAVTDKSPNPPPPTPTTPGMSRTHTRNSSSVSSITSPRSPPPTPGVIREEPEERTRPTTTDAVARRMISAALGVRTKSTKEQRDYDAAMREKEKRRLEEERERRREEEGEKEKTKMAVWDS